MPNHYFRFKQFTIFQDRCAMKVCTDACLFGAWVTAAVRQYGLPAGRILDIGAGTGLLSLMLAQELPGTITAIELDEEAFGQAGENIVASLWKDRVTLIQGDVKIYDFNDKYDLIVSNPPFFENGLRSDKQGKNRAKHDDGLLLEELIRVVHKLLTPNGHFAVLLPYHRMEYMIALAKEVGLHVRLLIRVQQSDKHGFFRVMLLLGYGEQQMVEETIVVKEGNVYSKRFAELLEKYYL